MSADLWSPADRTNEVRLGDRRFRLQSRHVDGHWFIVGQSLAEPDHVESDLIALESANGRAQALVASAKATDQNQSSTEFTNFLNYGAGYQPGSAQMFH